MLQQLATSCQQATTLSLVNMWLSASRWCGPGLSHALLQYAGHACAGLLCRLPLHSGLSQHRLDLRSMQNSQVGFNLLFLLHRPNIFFLHLDADRANTTSEASGASRFN